MGLYSRLLRLHSLYPEATPREDFLTEIVADLFDRSPQTLISWLESLNVLPDKSYSGAFTSTQVEVPGLPDHGCSSRFDILIQLPDDTVLDWIVIESKIDSGETGNQLQRYAEILHNKADVDEKVLIYITHHPDPKDEEEIFENIPDTSVRFVQTRWHSFCQFLKSRPQDPVIVEITRFMEEQRMARPYRFLPAHIASLMNLGEVTNLLDETMDETVQDRVKQVLQSANVPAKLSGNELYDYNAYLLYSQMCEDVWFHLGYWMGAELDYPQIGIMLETPSNAERRADVIRAMREIVADHPDWDGWGFDDPEEAPGIDRLCSLEEFLSKENHVEAIREYFLDCLDELEGLVKTYSILLG